MTDKALNNARAALRRVVSEGKAPNGIAPADCGPWCETVEGIYDAWDRAGTAGVRKAWDAATRGNAQLIALLADEQADQVGVEPAGWGNVLPFHNADLPPFPLDIFPPWLREYCEAVTETMQTPPDLAGMLALSVLSAAVARRIQVQARPGYIEPVNVYTVTSLPPGSRKSPVFRAMMAPLIKFERDELARVEDAIADAEVRRDILEKQLEGAKRKAATAKGSAESERAFEEVDELKDALKNTTIPPRPKLIVDDVTPEPLASILAEHGRVAVLSSEGDIFAIMAGRYSSGAPNIGVYKKGHAGESVRVERRNRSEYAPNACITMGITTQPEVMRSFGQNAAFRSEGLLARFFYALPRSTVGTRAPTAPPIPDHVRSRYFRLMLDLLTFFNSENSGNSGNEKDNGNTVIDHYIDDSINITTIEIFDTGRNRFDAFNAWLEPQLAEQGALHPIVDWASKLGGGVLRIAGLLHVAENISHNSHNSHNTISDANIARAIRLAHYLIAHAHAAYAEIGADPAVESAKMVLRWIEKTGARRFTKRDCYQGVKGTLKRADDLDPVLSLLIDHGYVREVESAERPGPGRKPSPLYDVNPLVFESSHNSHNSQNSRTVGASYDPPPPVEYEQPTYRSIEGYDE